MNEKKFRETIPPPVAETVSRPLCSTCRFWQRGEDTPLEGGECRIRAPGAAEGFAVSFADDWCGEHKALVTSPTTQWTDAEMVRFTTHNPYGRSDP